MFDWWAGLRGVWTDVLPLKHEEKRGLFNGTLKTLEYILLHWDLK